MHNLRATTAGLVKRMIKALRSSAARFLTEAASFIPQLVAAGLLIAVAMILVLIVKPPTWLPSASQTDALLGTILTAQAAIAAFTLAVTLFMMQGVKNSDEVDDRMYREYINRSWVRAILRNSLLAVGVTAAVLLGQKFVSGIEDAASVAPGLTNLVFLAIAAFIFNLIFAGALFERAIYLARPEHWTDIRRRVNERDIREALQAYLQRGARAAASLLASEPDITTVLPDPEEGSADEAVRGLLDEARRAMRERRHREFTRTIDSITNLITYALDEMEKSNLKWGPPGAQPEWPPLRELGRNLYPFREDIIREGTRDYVFELLRMDYWLVSTGMKRRCGEMFSSGLTGYRYNYQIANRHAEAELREILRDRFGQAANMLMYQLEPEELFPYVREMINHQGVMLSAAMHLNQVEDYRGLHIQFNSFFQYLRWQWNVDTWPKPPEAELYDHLKREYRITLMGLAGRAALVDQTGRINNSDAYLDIARQEYLFIEELANDIALAITPQGQFEAQLWFEWEMEEVPQGEASFIQAEQYPLAFFTIRLMELLTTQGETLNLHGRANQVLAWFSNNSERVQHLVHIDPEASLEGRREFAVEALRLAVRFDEGAEEIEIIGRELSPERIRAFVEGVRTAATQNNVVEQVFRTSGTFLSLPSGTAGCPGERRWNRLEPKGYFAEDSSAGQYYYSPVQGDGAGRSLVYNTMLMLCTALDEHAPRITAPLDTPEAMIKAIDEVISELDAPTEQLLLAAGDWFQIELALRMEQPEGYIPQWQLQEPAMPWKMGRYRGHIIVQGPKNGDRRLYIVDPATWGILLRGQFEDGQYIRADITPVSRERAQSLLSGNPNYFPDEPDRESKLRKLQNTVHMEIGIQEEFQVKDSTRARRVTDSTIREQQTSNDVASQP